MPLTSSAESLITGPESKGGLLLCHLHAPNSIASSPSDCPLPTSLLCTPTIPLPSPCWLPGSLPLSLWAASPQLVSLVLIQSDSPPAPSHLGQTRAGHWLRNLCQARGELNRMWDLWADGGKNLPKPLLTFCVSLAAGRLGLEKWVL